MDTNHDSEQKTEVSGEHNDASPARNIGTEKLIALVTILAAMPKEFQENQRGGFIVSGLIILVLLAWITVTWIQYR